MLISADRGVLGRVWYKHVYYNIALTDRFLCPFSLGGKGRRVEMTLIRACECCG